MANSLNNRYINEEYPFHIVEFINIGRKPKVRKTDVIATKWLNVELFKKRCTVKYPPPPYDAESLKLFDIALSNLMDAPDHWQDYTVKIRGRAKTLNEAMFKLESLKENITVLTADTGESSTEAEKKAIESIRQKELLSHAETYKKTLTQPFTSKATVSKKANICKISAQSELSDDHSNSIERLPLATICNSSLTKSTNLNKEFKYRNIGFEQNLNVQNKSLTFNNSFEQKIIEHCADFKHQFIELRKEIKELKNENQALKSIFVNTFQLKKEFIGSVQQICEKFDYVIPFEHVNEFRRFNNQLAGDKELYEAVSAVLQTAIDSSLVISKCFVNMLKLFFSKQVAMQFIAIKNLKGKEKMKRTNFCNLMELLIKERRVINNLQTSDKELTSALSSVLSNSVSWYSSKNISINVSETQNNKKVCRSKHNNFENDTCIEQQVNEESSQKIKVLAVQSIEPPSKLQKISDAPFDPLLPSSLEFVDSEVYVENYNSDSNNTEVAEDEEEDFDNESYLKLFSV